MLDAATAGGVGLAVGAGVATFFSPCAYALLPSYVGFYLASVEHEAAPLAGAVSRGLAAAFGVLAAFALLSVAAFAASESLERHLNVLEYAVGFGLVALGLAVLAGVSIGWELRLPERRTSLAGFFGFGAVYAAAAAGCVAPVFLGVVLYSASLPSTGTFAVLGAYAVTFSALMLSATVATAVGHGVGYERVSGYRELVVKLAGVVFVVAGVLQILVAARIVYF